MNKQETIDSINNKIKELQAEVNKLKTEPDTSELVFKPKRGEPYEYIGNKGYTVTVSWDNDESDLSRLKVGNVFRVATAQHSAKYHIMNSAYDYWFPWSGQPKPKVLPKGLEYWDTDTRSWEKTLYDLCTYLIYRWKRELQS